MDTPSFKLAAYIQGDPKANKLALVMPGLLDTKDYPHMRSHTDYLAARGYYALSFDPPGTWESGGTTARYSITNCLKAVDELIQLHGNKPTLLAGHSLGGFIAALAAARNPHVQSIIAIMSPSSFVRQEDGEDKAAGWPLPKWQELGVRPAERDVPNDPAGKRKFNLPYSFVEDSLQYNSLAGLAKLTVPKLFIAGEHDPQIRPQMVQAAYDIAAKPKEMRLLNSDHNYRRRQTLIEEANNMIGAFLDKNHL